LRSTARGQRWLRRRLSRSVCMLMLLSAVLMVMVTTVHKFLLAKRLMRHYCMN